MQCTNPRVKCWLLLPLVVAACQQPAATSSELSEEDKTAIRGVFSTVVSTIRAADWDAFAATFADDAVFQPANSTALHGRDAIKEWATAGPKATPAFDFSNLQVFGEGNFAYATSDVAMNFEGIPADKAKQLVVLRKDPSGVWKAVAVSFNSDTPLMGTSPTTTTRQ
jgi:uncharacterized protein (TIGR02246 family)